jgi:hypothetical protein
LKLNLDYARTHAIKKVHFSSSSSYINLIRSKRNVSVHNNTFFLGHRGIVSKRESTCPQGDFSVTTTHLGFGFPQFSYSSLAYPFSKASVVGETWLLISFLPTQVLPLHVQRCVISSFLWVKGKLPLYPWRCLL